MTCERISPRESSSIGNVTSSTPYGLTNDHRERDRGAGEEAALAARPRRRTVDPATEEVQPEVREAELRTMPCTLAHSHISTGHHHERVATDDAVGHLDDPQQHEQEEHADDERPLRPEGEDAGERGDGEPARHAAGRARAGARGGTRGSRCRRRRDRRTAGCRTPPTLRYEHAVRHLGEPRLRDPLGAGRGVREHVVVRDAVVEDVLAGPQVPEERVVGQLRAGRRPSRTRRRPR